MKNIKKISALILALVMILAISATAMADGAATIGNGGTVGATNTTIGAASAANTVTFTNIIKAYNPETISVNAPNISYAFTIAPTQNVSASVTDAAGASAAVKNGVGTPTITTPISYTTASSLNAGSGGVANSQNVTVTFPANTFSNQGIYRYTITRTATGSAVTNGTVTLDGQGLSSNVNTVYLDVYVKEENNAAAVYGYVLHNISGNIASGTTETPKLAGFEDTYYTDNVTIGKTVVNDALAGQFDFAVAFSGTGTKDTDYVLTTTTTGSAVVTDQNSLKIGNGESVTYQGIPYGVIMTITETNNNAGVTYNAAVTGDVDSAVTAKMITTGDSSNSAAVTNNALSTASSKTVTFTNTLTLISPTGVALRVAPYALMLAAGIFLVLFSRRREEAEEA